MGGACRTVASVLFLFGGDLEFNSVSSIFVIHVSTRVIHVLQDESLCKLFINPGKPFLVESILCVVFGWK